MEIRQRQSEASTKMVFKVNTPNKTDQTIGKGMVSEIVYIFIWGLLRLWKDVGPNPLIIQLGVIHLTHGQSCI